MYSCCVLFRQFDGAFLADDMHFDLPRILHGFFDLTGNLAGELHRFQVVHFVGAPKTGRYELVKV